MSTLTRREFMKQLGITSGGLIIGLNIVSCETKKIDISKLDKISPNIWVTLLENGDAHLVVHRSEMGQGIRTSLAAVLADELEADLSKVKIQQAVGDKKYGGQNTDGSRSVRNFYTTLRRAGASVKELLVRAGAQKMGVDPSECYADSHYIYHKPSGNKEFYGDLVAIAKSLELNDKIELKNKSEFKYIGTELDNLDNHLFVTGQAEYGIDSTLPDMVYASIQRSPVTGGKILNIDKSETLKQTGVLDVIEIKGTPGPALFNPIEGVAVIATNSWAAEQGKLKLKITWDDGPNKSYTSDTYRKTLEKSVKSKGKQYRNDGNVSKVFKRNNNTIDALYYTPHLTHAPMETPAALAWVQGEKCDVWVSIQTPQRARSLSAQALGVPEENVTVNVQFLGGGFGRKSKPDFVVEAVKLSKVVGKPVKVFWSREDDIKHGYLHSVSAQYLKAAIDKNNDVEAWLHRSDIPPISATFNPSARGTGSGVSQGASTMPYDIKNVRVESGNAQAHVRIGWLRSVYSIFHGFAVNSFVDELAHHRGMDPLEHQLQLIGNDRNLFFSEREKQSPFIFNTGRLKHVLQKAAKNAGWGKSLPKDHGMGLAVMYSFYSYVAQVVEVSMKDGKLKVVNVNTVIDCGTVINKDSVKNQMEGSVIFGLSLALYGNITAKEGKVEQSNFHDYQMLRMPDAPNINVEIVETNNPATGVGEPAVPPLAPALVNAIYDASKKRYRELPLMKHGIV